MRCCIASSDGIECSQCYQPKGLIDTPVGLGEGEHASHRRASSYLPVSYQASSPDLGFLFGRKAPMPVANETRQAGRARA